MGNYFGSSKDEIVDVDEAELFRRIKGLQADAQIIQYDAEQKDALQDLSLDDRCEVRVSLKPMKGPEVTLNGTIFSPYSVKDHPLTGPIDNTKRRYLIIPKIKTLTGKNTVMPEFIAGGRSSQKQSTLKRNASLELENQIIQSTPCIQILDRSWEHELRQFKKIKVCPVGDCADIYEAVVQQHLGPRRLADQDEDGDVCVVVAVKTTRIQSDTEMALEQANISRDKNIPTIIMMFQQIIGTVTVDDVQSTFYSSPNAYKTFHVPYRKK